MFRAKKRGNATYMVEVHTILARIAKDLRQYSGTDDEAAIDEFIHGSTFNFHLAITTDVEETELDFLERYGHGHTFYFRLENYAHGKLLASQLYWIFLGIEADMNNHTGIKFSPGDKLYLFVHVMDLFPPAVQHSLKENN